MKASDGAPEKGAGRRWRALASAAGAALALLAGPAVAADTPLTAQQFLDQLMQTPVYGGLYRELRDDFPDEFAGLGKLFEAQQAAHADIDHIAAAAFAYMHGVEQTHLSDAASAPSPQIKALIDADVDLVVALSKENVQACADYGMSGFKAGVQLSPRANEFLTTAAIATLKASRAGIDHPTARPDLSAEDVGAITSGMKTAGASDAQVLAMMQSKLAAASAQDQCVVTVALFRAMQGAPGESGVNFMTKVLPATKETPKSP